VIVRRRGACDRGRGRMAGGAVVVEGVLPINGTAATAAAADLRLQLLLLGCWVKVAQH